MSVSKKELDNNTEEINKFMESIDNKLFQKIFKT